jgi:hypothetical protein
MVERRSDGRFDNSSGSRVLLFDLMQFRQQKSEAAYHRINL